MTELVEQAVISQELKRGSQILATQVPLNGWTVASWVSVSTRRGILLTVNSVIYSKC